jgi:hypothetical protein
MRIPMLRGLINGKHVDTSAYSPNENQVAAGVINRDVNAMVTCYV